MFAIFAGNDIVGRAEVKQKGLYYHITCVCNPPTNGIHRIIMQENDIQKDLGICVPQGDEFTLFKRIPIKTFQGNDFMFQLVEPGKVAHIVSENMPFEYLDKLETARLQRTNGQLRIVIDSVPVPQDSDRTP